MLFFSEFPRANTLLTLRNPQLKQHFTVPQVSRKNEHFHSPMHGISETAEDYCEIIIIRHYMLSHRKNSPHST